MKTTKRKATPVAATEKTTQLKLSRAEISAVRVRATRLGIRPEDLVRAALRAFSW